jgi:serine/threonine-protein kinase
VARPLASGKQSDGAGFGKAPQVPKTGSDEELAREGIGILKRYCYRCHGVEFKVPRFNILDRAVLTARRARGKSPYVVPGSPGQSVLWQRVGVEGDMPPSGAEPTNEDKVVLRRWIEAGAPFPGRPARPFLGEKDILVAVRAHLRQTPAEDRPYQRYFTLTHLSNNHRHVSADELRLYRAALAKLVNSLSWKRAIVLPRAVDRDETVFNVDMRELGWDRHDTWKEVLKAYPYGLTHGRDALGELAREVTDLAGCELPYLRADWFVATAARPPLYHQLLRLPGRARDLEDLLGVDVDQDFLAGRLARAGVISSGVSRQNRVLDRHEAEHGAYWKSYDFRSSEGTGNVLHFPLGPAFAGNSHARQAFEHAGGEIIFNLPNGLQAYLLVDGQGNRIDAGPVEIVRDPQETAGSPVVVNGLSCLACHKHGMVRFEDRVRAGSALAGDALVKVRELYRPKEEMDRLLDADEARFLKALGEAAGPFLRVGEDRGKDIRAFPEPVGAAARLYVKDLGPEEVALELGLEDPKKLQELIRDSRKLRALGLGPLAEGGTIKREVWGSREFTTSLFHEVARELGLGTPFVPF